jgi:hypothetical protein
MMIISGDALDKIVQGPAGELYTHDPEKGFLKYSSPIPDTQFTSKDWEILARANCQEKQEK